MEEDIKIYGYLSNLIEVPADVLMYWTLKAIDLKGTISEQDIHKYHDAICKAHSRFKYSIQKPLAFHFPYADNYQNEVFEEIILPNGKVGFKIRKTSNSEEQELLEYRLVKLEAFIRKQTKDVREMFELADKIYRKEFLVMTSSISKDQKPKKKILGFGKNIKEKFHIKK